MFNKAEFGVWIKYNKISPHETIVYVFVGLMDFKKKKKIFP